METASLGLPERQWGKELLEEAFNHTQVLKRVYRGMKTSKSVLPLTK